MPEIRNLCVYCGSSDRVDAVYRAAASDLGTALARAGIGLVYGGGRVGLMGILADAVLAGGGLVTGIIPDTLRNAELAHTGVNELIVVPSMHDRKRQMAERADAFAVLPGGIGTLDETFEILTWRYLRLHDKPIFLVDVAGYWGGLRSLIGHLIASGFASDSVASLLRVVPDIAVLMAALSASSAGREVAAELL